MKIYVSMVITSYDVRKLTIHSLCFWCIAWVQLWVK